MNQTQRRSPRALCLFFLTVVSLGAAKAGPRQTAVPPITALAPLQTTRVTPAGWVTAGGGKNDAGMYVQDGRIPFSLTLPVTTGANFRLKGEVLLPINAALTVNLLNGEAPAYTSKLSRNKYALRWERMDIPSPPADALTTWLPFSFDSLGGVLHLSWAGQTQIAKATGVGVALALQGGAQVRNLEGCTYSALSPRMEPVLLDSLANTDATGIASPLGREAALDAAGWPQDLVTTGGVPFAFSSGPANAVDIKPAMSGWNDAAIRSVKSYLNPGIRMTGVAPDKTSQAYLQRPIFGIPAAQYSAIHLLAFSRDGEGFVPRFTLRFGWFGASAGILEDEIVAVPSLTGNEAANALVVSRVPVKLASGKSGYLYHLRVPLQKSANLTGLTGSWPASGGLQVEFTRDIHTRVPVPDPFEYGSLPVGPPSGVVVLAATMERSPLTMTCATDEPGNVFTEGQHVVYKVNVTNTTTSAASGKLSLSAAGPGTQAENCLKEAGWNTSSPFTLQAGESKEISLDITPGQRGWFKGVLNLEVDGKTLQQRDTTFAVLAPDTRQARDDSPFGVWCFWNSHTQTRDENRVDKLASLIHKGGWRWTYGGDPVGKVSDSEASTIYKRFEEKYNLRFTLQTPPQGYQRATGWYDEAAFTKDVAPWLQAAHHKGVDSYFKVLHESRSSTALIRRYTEYLGGAPYAMPDAEKNALETQIKNVEQYTRAIRQADAQAKIVLFNDYPAFVAEYLKRGFPSNSFDVIGTEVSNFMRQPECQPDWLSLLGTLHQLRRIQKQYGYDKPIWTTEALYHATQPGNLSLHDQGVIYVREAILALANGVQRMAAAGLITDSSDDYYWSNWGGAGFCYRDPEYNPKPSYAMYAWLTQVLDQASYSGHLDTGSTILHLLDFKKPDRTHVYPLWTVRGQQDVTLRFQGTPPVVYDVYGNKQKVLVQGNVFTLPVTDTPQYITGATITGVASRQPIETKRAGGTIMLDFDKPSQLQVDSTASAVLAGVWSTPYITGNFETAPVKEDGVTALRVDLKPDQDSRNLLPRYIQLNLTQPLILGKRPRALTMRIKGNGGWGRLMFQFVDAQGRTWTSCGNQLPGAANSSDSEGLSFISFDGWQTIEMPLPGQYQSPDQFVHWPRNFDWWPTGSPVDSALAAAVEKAKAAGAATMPVASGHDEVSYPIKLTKIIVAMRPNILYIDEEVPVKNPSIYLDDLGIIEAAQDM